MHETLSARTGPGATRTADRVDPSSARLPAQRSAAGGAPPPPPPPAGRVYDEAAQTEARRQLVQRAAEMRVPATGAGTQGGAVVQRTWKQEMRPPPGGVPEDSDWIARGREYRNVQTGETYDPDTRTLDNPDEPFGLQELDEREHGQLMQEIFGGAAVPVYVDDRDNRVYDPAARRESGGRLGRVRVLDAAAHARRMEEIQADLDYRDYVESGEEAYDQGYEDGRRDARNAREYDDAYDGDHADAYEEGYAHGYDELESSYTTLERGQYVDQDDRDEEYDEDNERDVRLFHYIGRDLAYTFYLSYCTALAMYHPGTGLSFLAHNDSNNEDRLAVSVSRYFDMVRAAGDEEGAADVLGEIVTELYAGDLARDEAATSIAAIRIALRTALGKDKGGPAFMDNLRIIPDMSQGHVVAVGNRKPPRVAPAAIQGSRLVDIAVNCIFLEQHRTDNGMSVVGILNSFNDQDAEVLVHDEGELRAALAQLRKMPAGFRHEMADEIDALDVLFDRVHYMAGRQ